MTVAGIEQVFDTGPVPVSAPDLAALRLLGDRVRPLAGAGERTLPVPAAFTALLPQAGLQRGATVATDGVAATSLALALAGPTTTSGSWMAVVGLPRLGLLAASELGVDLERVLLVAEPEPPGWPAAVAALLDAVDVVLVRPPGPISVTVQRRLQARARERGSVLLHVGGRLGVWAQAPDLVVSAVASAWVGLGPGHGRLQARQVQVSVTGRRGADRPRHAQLWLPGPDGGIALVDARPVVPIGPIAPAPLREVG